MERTDRYQEKDSPGRVIIINNFDYNDRSSKRTNSKFLRMTSDGSTCEEKASNLEKVFRELNFRGIRNEGKDDVMVVKNYTKTQLQELMKTVKSNDLKDDYCFICVIMSYGEPGLITCVPRNKNEQNDVKEHQKAPDSMNIPIADLLDELKGEGCPALVGRPKIFLVQTQPWPTDTADDLSERPEGQEDARNTIPREADFLVHAVCENQDYVVDAWVAGLKECNNKKGEKQKQVEINTFLIRCNDKVREKYIKEKCEPLVPCVTSLLTKKMYINYRASGTITVDGSYSSGQGLAIMICNFIHTTEDESKFEEVHGKKWFEKCLKREGACSDVENMESALGTLGYDVKIHRNQTKKEMEKLLIEAAEKYKEYKSFALVISSHGGEREEGKDGRIIRDDYVQTFDKQNYLIKDIIEVFKNRNSTDVKNAVPKLFFIQACRLPSSQYDETDFVDGTETPCGIDPGYSNQKGRRNSLTATFRMKLDCSKSDPNTYDVSNTGPIGVSSSDVLLDVVGTRTTPQVLPLTLTNIPCYNDMLLMFASPQGFFALRDSSEGSFFIRELAKEIKKNCSNDSEQINLIQTLINVSYNMSAIKPLPVEFANSKCNAVLVPSIVHTLVKDVVFIPPV